MKKSQNFLQGAIILSAAVAVCKVIGAVFKIPLLNFMHTGGATHFNMAYQVYSTMYAISTAGLPVAVSKMVSEAEARGDGAESRRVFSLSFMMFMALGLVGGASLFLFADNFAALSNNPDGALAVKCIAPTMLFACMVSAFRGFHQGRQNMVPTGVSQVIEAAGKLIVGLGLAYWLFVTVKDSVYEASGAVLGVSVGTVFSFLFIAVYSIRSMRGGAFPRSGNTRSGGKLVGELVKIAVPITLTSSILSVTNLIDGMQVMGRLQNGAGIAYEKAKFLSDSYVISQSLYLLPPAFLATLAVSVVPAIAAALAKRNASAAGSMASSAIRLTLLLALPAAAGLFSLSAPILNLLYPGKAGEPLVIAAPIVQTFSIAVPFVCLVTLTNAILQATGRMYLPVISMTIGAALKISLNYVLIGTPEINIYGTPVGTVVCYSVITLVNVVFIAVKIRPPKLLVSFLKPLAAAVLMGAVCWQAQLTLSRFIGNSLATVIAVLLGVTLYIVLAALTRAMTYDDVMLLPGGGKLAKLLKIRQN